VNASGARMTSPGAYLGGAAVLTAASALPSGGTEAAKTPPHFGAGDHGLQLRERDTVAAHHEMHERVGEDLAETGLLPRFAPSLVPGLRCCGER